MEEKDKDKKPEKRNLAHLRERMFDAIDDLKAGNISTDNAKAMAAIGDVIVKSAKVEVDFLKLKESGQSDFLDVGDAIERAEFERKKLLPENQKYFRK